MRAEGNTLIGTAIHYGEVANIGGMKEMFQAGAFEGFQDVMLTLQHKREIPLSRVGSGLQIIDSDSALEIRAELNPQISAAKETLELVRTGILRGLSIEFQALKQHFKGDLRIVTRAKIFAISVVDVPAYSNSTVQVRARKPKYRWKSKIPFNTDLSCDCVEGDCQKAVIVENSFQDFSEIIKNKIKPNGDDVTAFVNRYENTVASLTQGTLRLAMNKNDGIDVEIDMQDSDAVKNLYRNAAGTTILARPYFVKSEESESYTDGDKEVIVNENLRGIMLGSSDKVFGWPKAEYFKPVATSTRRQREYY